MQPLDPVTGQYAIRIPHAPRDICFLFHTKEPREAYLRGVALAQEWERPRFWLNGMVLPVSLEESA